VLRICFVCWGNICRSPTAMGVMRAMVQGAGLEAVIEVDSAGTSAEHRGGPPDRRTVAEARRRGLRLEHRAWQFSGADFDRFDLVLAADEANAERLRRRARDDDDLAKIRLLREFDPAADGDLDVPDPYYGGPDGFAEVYDTLVAACSGLLTELRSRHDW
jgi:protein-tyrosine phosphatase